VTRTYVDAGVLIAGARGDGAACEAALTILEDPDREFVSSAFVRLEVEPKAIYNGKEAEASFYDAFFAGVSSWAEDFDSLLTRAYEEARTNGIAAMDSLHVAAAAAVGAEELVTTGKPEKPIFRTSLVQVTSIRPK